jgi:hypothetical protein
MIEVFVLWVHLNGAMTRQIEYSNIEACRAGAKVFATHKDLTPFNKRPTEDWYECRVEKR